jgi:ABC-type uncharacterized transport system permease subunit
VRARDIPRRATASKANEENSLCVGIPNSRVAPSSADSASPQPPPARQSVAAVILFSIFLLTIGQSPMDFLDLVWRGAFGSWFSLLNTLQRAALTALCVALPGQLGLVVIGGEAVPYVVTLIVLIISAHGGHELRGKPGQLSIGR